MGKKYISAGLTIFMVMALASPLFSIEDDTPSCCQKVEMDCCMQQELGDCPMAVSSCDNSIMLLLISGLKAPITQTNELTVVESIYFGFNSLSSNKIITADIQFLSVSQPTSFLTPLLI